MVWARIDDDFFCHPKVLSAGNECVGVWVRLLSWSNRYQTDGDVPYWVALSIAGERENDDGPSLIDHLVAVGLLDDPGEGVGGYRIHDFLQYNPSKEHNDARQDDIKQKRSEAGKRGAKARWQNGKKVANRMANRMANGKQKDSPDPDPDPLKEYSEKICHVLEHYRTKNPGRGKKVRPHDKDWKRIADRLGEGFSVEDLCLAVDGNLIDTWHAERRKHALEYVFRNRTKVEDFIDLAKNGKGPGKPRVVRPQQVRLN